MSATQIVRNIKARDMQVGDTFTGFGQVWSFVIEDNTVWAQIGRRQAKARLFAFDADMDISTRRAVAA